MEIMKLKQTEWVDEAKRHIAGGFHKIFHTTVDTPVTLVHRRSQVDEELCAEMGYDIYEGLYNGGTLIANKGDLVFAHFYDIENGWRDRYVEYFLAWLKNKGLNAEYVDNDVLVDDRKVCGTCITRYGRIDYTTIFISIDPNLDHIKAICRKPMKKVPKGLSDYGITSEEVEQMFLDFCEADEANYNKGGRKLT